MNTPFLISRPVSGYMNGIDYFFPIPSSSTQDSSWEVNSEDNPFPLTSFGSVECPDHQFLGKDRVVQIQSWLWSECVDFHHTDICMRSFSL